MIQQLLYALPTLLLSAALCASALLALTRAPQPTSRGMTLLFGGVLLLTASIGLAAADIVETGAIAALAAVVTMAGALSTMRHHLIPDGGR